MMPTGDKPYQMDLIFICDHCGATISENVSSDTPLPNRNFIQMLADKHFWQVRFFDPVEMHGTMVDRHPRIFCPFCNTRWRRFIEWLSGR